ncbi:cytochrome b [Pseudomonas syringae]|nr:cytochrome b [Pseudomonas syringae]MBD8574178.1 cytochrome b [Pseudomonas syringae]MBD8791675.1 cytochrome b [Pseudomonas syringae]MBD8801035.1 cytochrome b [Pseudomonas syringae]MBD8810439.1 cytochrome b [Pseudomonas syringae]
MAALVVLAYCLILSRTQFTRGSDYRVLVVQSHYWTGILLLALAFFRLAERRRHTPPAITPPLQGAVRTLATLSHYLMYGFLFVQPVLGLLTVLVEKGSLPILFTDAAIPWPLPTSGRTAEYFEDLHKLFARLFYYVAGVHVLAALWHHFIRKDNTLKRMR